MPFPVLLLIPALTAVFAAVVASIPDSVTRITKEELARLIMGEVSDAEGAAIKEAFLKMGLDIDPEDGINAQTITAAINAGRRSA